LPHLQPDLTRVVGLADRIVPPATADKQRRVLPVARIERVSRQGPLLHEESAVVAARCCGVR